MRYITQKFESVAAFSGYLLSGKTQPYFEGHEASQSTERPRWYGTASFEDADNLFKCGDLETKKRIESAAGGAMQLKSFANVERITNQRATYGHKVSMGAYIAGSPKCFVRRVKDNVKGRTATIVYNLTYNCGVDTEEMARVAANLIKAVLVTERQRGIKFNLYIAFATVESGTIVANFVKVKSSSQWLNLNTMAYSLANPSMLRRHFFRCLEVTPNVPSSFVGGYGYVVTGRDFEGAIANVGIKADCIMSGETMLHKTSEEIKTILNRQWKQ